MDSAIRAVIGTIIFSVILFLVYYYNKKLLMGKNFVRRSKYMQSLDKLYLFNDKWIELVKIGDEINILGVTANSIQKLGTVAQEELDEVVFEKNNYNFSTILEKFTKKENE